MDPSILRLIDANVNRSREALRLIEDFARFVLDDADAAAAAKRCRHQLRSIVEAVGAGGLLAARDILSDVGRGTKTDSETHRTCEEEVVRAAFGRLSEAARVLGEFAKLLGPAPAAVAESVRYQAYELEQRIILRGGLRRRFRAVRLYVLITASLCRGPWLETAAAALRGGADCLQLREKAMPDGELLRRARQLRALTCDHGAMLAINDRPDIARLARADIVHLGQDDLPVREARHIAGANLLVGKSTHTLEQFDAACAEEPDYIAVGPIFPSGTKPQPHIAGLPTLAAVRPRTDLPLVAIGGITAADVAQVRSAGADCVAVCAEVIAADDVEAAARALRAAAG